MRRRELSPRAAIALSVFKASVLGSLLTLTVAAAVNAGADSSSGTPPVTDDAYTQVVQRVMTNHQCSTTGFGPDTLPTSALIRTNQGRLQMVSFDKGWEVFTGHRPGTLVAVCLAREPGPRQ